MSLLALINKPSDSEDNVLAVTTTQRIPSLFKLVCLQIGFPEIFSKVSENPNIREWTVEGLAKAWQINTKDYDRVSLQRDGYQEEWQHVVVLLMRDDPWLAGRSKDAVEILQSFLSGLEATTEDPDGKAELGMLLDSVAITSVGATTTSMGNASVKNDHITTFCRRLHLALIKLNIAPQVEVNHIYAKQTGGRNYVFPLNEPLEAGRISIRREHGGYDLCLGVSIPVTSTRKNSKLRMHMEEISKGVTISEVEYPYFLKEVGLIELEDQLDEIVEAFRLLTVRVTTQIGKFI